MMPSCATKRIWFAERLRWRDFERALTYGRMHADPDGADQDAERQRAESFVSLVRVGDRFELRGRLDAVWGTVVDNALHRLEQGGYDEDVAEARARLGCSSVQPAPLRHTPAQRRALALVRMAERAMAAGRGARLPRPLLTIVAGLDDVAGHLCETEEGTRSPAASCSACWTAPMWSRSCSTPNADTCASRRRNASTPGRCAG